jgi:hypothetical protein
MSSIGLIDPGDQVIFKMDWSGSLAVGVTLSNVVHTLPAPLTVMSEGLTDANKSTFVKIRDAVHGMLYQVEAQVTLSTGEIMNRQFPLRCLNG